MTTTTSYGTWYNHTRSLTTIEESVGSALGEFGDDYDVDALVSEYADAINEALPDGVVLAGSEFYGPYFAEDHTWEGELDIAARIEGVDFWEIAARHELWTADDAAEHLGYKGDNRAGSARKKLSAWGIKAHSYRSHPSSGRPQAVYKAAEIREAQANRPGRGARTDLTDAG